MTVIQVSEGVEATADLARRVEGRYFLPGETVRRRTAEGASCGVVVHTDGSDLLVSATRVVGNDESGLRVAYAFEGVSGLHDAEQYGDPRSTVHHYAALVQRQGATWLVPLDGNRAPVGGSGPALRLTERLSRSARYHLAIEDEALAGDTFFAALETDPMIGEFGVLLNEDGTADLDYSPWNSSAGALEIAIAEEAIAEAGHPAVRAPIN